MAPKISTRNYNLTRGRIGRRELIAYVLHYAQEHPEIGRMRRITISFHEIIREPETGEEIGGWVQGNHIQICVRGRRNRILDETDYIITLAHELHHMLEARQSGQAVRAKCKLYIHTADEEPEEGRAITASLEELARWQGRRYMSHTEKEYEAYRRFSSKRLFR